MADPDLQITGGRGRRHPDPEIEGGAFPPKIFLALRTLVCSKNKGDPGPFPGSATVNTLNCLSLRVCTLCVLVILSSFILHLFMYHEF